MPDWISINGIIPQYFRKNKFLDENRILILECYREIGSSEYSACISNFADAGR
jgi:hypothetical protein